MCHFSTCVAQSAKCSTHFSLVFSFPHFFFFKVIHFYWCMFILEKVIFSCVSKLKLMYYSFFSFFFSVSILLLTSCVHPSFYLAVTYQRIFVLCTGQENGKTFPLRKISILSANSNPLARKRGNRMVIHPTFQVPNR